MKNKGPILSAGLIILIVTGALCAGCTTATITNPGIAGKYVDEDNDKYFIELNADGTFYYKSGASFGYSGKWEMKANALRLHTETLGTTIELEKKGNTLYRYSDSGRVTNRFIRE
jgi:hypothetical protein